jgi:hypothetical protein
MFPCGETKSEKRTLFSCGGNRMMFTHDQLYKLGQLLQAQQTPEQIRRAKEFAKTLPFPESQVMSSFLNGEPLPELEGVASRIEVHISEPRMGAGYGGENSYDWPEMD